MVTLIYRHLPVVAGLLTPASLALAHPGHDHGHWASPAVHAVLLGAALALVGAAAARARKRKTHTGERGEL